MAIQSTLFFLSPPPPPPRPNGYRISFGVYGRGGGEQTHNTSLLPLVRKARTHALVAYAALVIAFLPGATYALIGSQLGVCACTLHFQMQVPIAREKLFATLSITHTYGA